MSITHTKVSIRVSNSLLFTTLIRFCSVLLKGVLVGAEGLDVVDLEREEAAVRRLEGLELLGELLEAERVVLLLLLRLEHLDLGFADVHGGRLRVVVGGDVVVSGEALVGLGSQVEAPVQVARAQSEVHEATRVPDLGEGLLRG